MLLRVPDCGVGGGVTVIVQGTVVDRQGLARTMQKVMLQHGARNSQTYQPYKRS